MRGSTVTTEMPSEFSQVFGEIGSIVRDFGSQYGDCAIIIQKSILGIHGHLSNERRITKDAKRWIYEIHGAFHPAHASDLEVEGTSRADLDPLIGGSLDSLLLRLANWASCQKGGRWHFEWVFDGERLYVVQADPAEGATTDSAPPMADWQELVFPQVATGLRVIRSPTPEDAAKWKKVAAQREFQVAGVPATPLFILTDPDAWTALRNGSVPSRLEEDLRILSSFPFTGRTDIGAKKEFSVNLPRSDTLQSAEDASAFLLKAAQDPRLEPASEPCAIFHRFIPAVAGAFGWASPGGNRVLIDSTWGVPDGLSFYPHDSFVVINHKISDRRIRYKSDFIDVDKEGKWYERPSGRPWDWRQSLTNSEVEEISRLTQALADHREDDTQVMFFVGVPRELSSSGILPWVILPVEAEPEESVDGYDPRGYQPSPIVRDAGELRRLLDREGLEGEVRRVAFRVRPGLERDNELIEAVGRLAKRRDVAIEFHGSRLGHAYYVLRRCGTRVILAEPPSARIPPQGFGKLVRDLIPAKISSGGERAAMVRVAGEQLFQLLRQKFLEEAYEVYDADDRQALIEELADLYEVIRSMLDHADLSEEQVRLAAAAKRSTRGGFDKGWVLLETHEDSAPSTLDLGLGQDRFASREEVIRATQPLPRSRDGASLTIPLVPPDRRLYGRRPIAVKLTALDREALLQYDGSNVVVRFRAVPAENPTQLELAL